MGSALSLLHQMLQGICFTRRRNEQRPAPAPNVELGTISNSRSVSSDPLVNCMVATCRHLIPRYDVQKTEEHIFKHHAHMIVKPDTSSLVKIQLLQGERVWFMKKGGRILGCHVSTLLNVSEEHAWISMCRWYAKQGRFHVDTSEQRGKIISLEKARSSVVQGIRIDDVKEGDVLVIRFRIQDEGQKRTKSQETERDRRSKSRSENMEDKNKNVRKSKLPKGKRRTVLRSGKTTSLTKSCSEHDGQNTENNQELSIKNASEHEWPTPLTQYTSEHEWPTPPTQYTPEHEWPTPPTQYTSEHEWLTPPTQYTPEHEWPTPPTQYTTKNHLQDGTTRSLKLEVAPSHSGVTAEKNLSTQEGLYGVICNSHSNSEEWRSQMPNHNVIDSKPDSNPPIESHDSLLNRPRDSSNRLENPKTSSDENSGSSDEGGNKFTPFNGCYEHVGGSSGHVGFKTSIIPINMNLNEESYHSFDSFNGCFEVGGNDVRDSVMDDASSVAGSNDDEDGKDDIVIGIHSDEESDDSSQSMGPYHDINYNRSVMANTTGIQIVDGECLTPRTVSPIPLEVIHDTGC